MNNSLKSLNFKIDKVKITPSLAQDKPDLKAQVAIILKDDNGRMFCFSGFTLRESKKKPGTYYLGLPGRGFGKKLFRYCLLDITLKKQIEEEATAQYDYENIPIIDK